MFQQFFAGNDKNRNQAISMAEIRYVATLLNEKISDEDVSFDTFWLSFLSFGWPLMSPFHLQVIEMLEYASSTRDRTVNAEAFSKIMVDVKAV